MVHWLDQSDSAADGASPRHTPRPNARLGDSSEAGQGHPPVAPEPDPRLTDLTVPPEAHGSRLDVFLAGVLPDASRAYSQRLIAKGRVAVDGLTATKASDRVAAGQQVRVYQPQPIQALLAPLDLPLEVLYEDADVLVLSKPAGLVVHPAAGHVSDTLVNALLARYPALRIGDDLRPGIVHRLDKDTSGVMVIARNDAAMRSLSGQIAAHTVDKRYLALVYGRPRLESGTIEAPIGRDPRDRKRMAVVSTGRAARTHYVTLEALGEYSLVEARLETGRTHQIRVHFAAICCPVAGDAVYGPRTTLPGLARQFLHAHRLGFRSPSSGEWLTFEASLPADLSAVLSGLRERV
jgi:23S rRNA pseudouridine1911/1915/1917 synthase